ncbi:hypothetical protein [Pseudoxanthomonas sp.]|uniref:terminase small subunit-like protein n=1 Tax=Pseudoxanthomonas sp. TaxID=1871049 RepID=UPI00261C3908|nr:hypothetical protein [Pseudoxanthomonas sp.]WDS36232.1 MAG: hypothetical protein O8I58_18505 [Pseudoxanthomonas sp.]
MDEQGAKEGPRPGRPSVYSDELLERICDELSKGTPLTQICRNLSGDGVALATRTVRDWCGERGEDDKLTERAAHVSACIARARELGEEALAEECLEIADDSRNDWMERAAEKGDEVALQFNGEHVQRSKLRIDTRLKLLAKFNPKRWGDKSAVELTGANGGPVATVTRIELVDLSGDGTDSAAA